MLKSISLAVASLVFTFSVRAQSEPQKSPAQTGACPPTIHDAAHTPARQNPPAVAATPKSTTEANADAKPHIDKNPPPLDPKNMDTSVKPGTDFFAYANGGWMKRNPIPPEYARWGSFNELIEKNNDALHAIAEKAAADSAKMAMKSDALEKASAAEIQKVGDYYASGMNQTAINAARSKPLEAEFQRIEAMKDRADVLKEIAHLHSLGVAAFFGFTSGQDDKNSTMVIAQAFQGGLGMPDRDYYTKDDAASKKLREQYLEHLRKMFTLLSEPAEKAKADAQTVMKIETSLAVPAMTRVQLRDPQAVYHKMKQSDLQALTPNWNWADYFKEINVADPGDINVAQPDFFKAGDKLFTDTSLADWKTYLRWHLIDDSAAELSNDFVNENFHFQGTILTGAEKLKPRWKRVVVSTDDALGEALGKLYVARNFPPEAKKRALEMVDNLKEALADRIKTLEWMDEPTKQEALKKLAAFTVKIGYPDKWRDYSMLKIDRGPYVLNAERAATFEVDRELKKIGKPVDRSEWGMTPPTVNAYYNPNLNEIVFPAGILQPPFFDPKADEAVNYGGMGAVIGHEMTHGFDDQGRQYDAAGNLRDWWSKESAEKFAARSKGIVAQYSAYEPLPGLHINGQLTEGENIADLGGVKVAYAAFQKALAKHPEEAGKKIDGFTPEQRFFLAYAQVWRANQRPEDLKLRLNTDPHSPGRFRTIGPLSNLPEFAKAFNLPDNCPMVRPPDERVNIW